MSQVVITSRDRELLCMDTWDFADVLKVINPATFVENSVLYPTPFKNDYCLVECSWDS